MMMDSQVQRLAAKLNMTYDEFVEEMRKRKAANVLKVRAGMLLLR